MHLQIALGRAAEQNENGMMKRIKGIARLIGSQPPTKRCRYKMVSSGMFAYQIKRYCENAM